LHYVFGKLLLQIQPEAIVSAHNAQKAFGDRAPPKPAGTGSLQRFPKPPAGFKGPPLRQEKTGRGGGIIYLPTIPGSSTGRKRGVTTCTSCLLSTV